MSGLKSVLQQYLALVDEYALVKVPNKVALVMIKAYQPFCDCTLDSYYLASNELYKRTQAIMQVLINNGYGCIIPHNLSFRELAFRASLASVLGVNTMAISDKWGSYFCISIILTDCELDKLLDMPLQDNNAISKCDNCKLCIDCCPTGAISDKGFCVDKCMRSWMNGEKLEKWQFKKIGNRFFGCNECQMHCPHNKKTTLNQAPLGLQYAIKDALYSVKPFKEYLGANYARGKIIYHNGIIQAANSLDSTHISRLIELKKNDKYSHNATMALELIINS